MKKPLAILLAFFIVFAPVYSNAVLPALIASVASNAGRVLVGSVIKKVSPQALANARKAAVGICTSNPKVCAGVGLGSLGLKLISDGWNIDVTNNDVTNDIDVDIYKINESPETCQDVFYYDTLKYNKNYQSTAAAVCNVVHQDDIVNPSYYSNYNIRDFSKVVVKTSMAGVVSCDFQFNKNNNLGLYTSSITPKKTCVMQPNPPVKIYINDSDLNQYITNNNINDIDILDIYNFDFSQYNNINIGGDTYNGTTINNDLAKSDPSETDKKVSADLKKKLDSKELSLDDVNDENCTKNEAGEYDKCGADKEPDPDNPDPDNPEEPEKNPTCELEENLFRKKICEWIDWTQTKHDKPESGNVAIIDKSDDLEIDDDRIVFDDQCPPPTPIELVVMGFPYSEELDYQPFCDFFGMLNPFVVGMGGISSALIIAGGIRRG